MSSPASAPRRFRLPVSASAVAGVGVVMAALLQACRGPEAHSLGEDRGAVLLRQIGLKRVVCPQPDGDDATVRWRGFLTSSKEGEEGRLMPDATLTSKGQITIPKAVRDALGVAAGDRIQFFVRDDGVVEIRPRTRDIRSLAGLIRPDPDALGATLEDFDEAIAQTARERMARRS